MRSYSRELLKGLLAHERPHWQAINESARPSFAMLEIRLGNTIPKPCVHDGGGLAESGRDIDELRAAGRARIVPRQTGLVVVGRVACSGLKEVGESHDVGKISGSVASKFTRA